MIFYTDDDPVDLEVFTGVVADAGREVTTFSSVQQMMRDLPETLPDAAMLFLDINMPMTTGLQALEHIRQSKHLRKLPVVMLSTSSHHAYIQESFHLGANMFIVKPSSYEKFKEALEFAIKTNWDKRIVTLDSFLYEPKR